MPSTTTYHSREIIRKGEKYERIRSNNGRSEICLGQATIRGIRITVSTILKQVASGMSTKEILKAYPELEEEDVVQALKYAAWFSSEKVRPIPLKGVASERRTG